MIRQRNRTRLLTLLLAHLAGGAVFSSAALPAQELPWLERGMVRLDFAPTFWTWDSRYGIDSFGNTQVEPLGWDLTTESLGSDVLPDLRELEASLADALGEDSYRVRLGASQAVIDQSRLTFPLRLEVGVTDWLTVGAMVPFSRPRTEMLFALETGEDLTNVGLSPMTTDAGGVSGFLNTFQTALETAQETHAGDPAVVDAQAFLEALTSAYDHETFFPADGSDAAATLQARMGEIREALAGLGVTDLPESVPVASSRLTPQEFELYMDGGVMRAAPLEDLTTPWKIGDTELTAAIRFLNHGFQPDSLGNLPNLRYQLGGGVLLRLGTGAQASSSRLFELNPAQGQTDLEGTLFGRLEVGSRLGAWGQVRYGIQTEGEITKRIAAPGEALPDWSRAAPLLWTPGNYLDVELSPRFFLTPDVSLGIRYHHWSKGEDSYALQPLDPDVLERVNYPPADLLNGETKETLNEVGFSLFYSTLDAHARGEAWLPLHLRATFFLPAGGSGGRTPKGGRVEAGLTIHKRIWGGGAEVSPAGNPEG